MSQEAKRERLDDHVFPPSISEELEASVVDELEKMDIQSTSTGYPQDRLLSGESSSSESSEEPEGNTTSFFFKQIQTWNDEELAAIADYLELQMSISNTPVLSLAYLVNEKIKKELHSRKFNACVCELKSMFYFNQTKRKWVQKWVNDTAYFDINGNRKIVTATRRITPKADKAPRAL